MSRLRSLSVVLLGLLTGCTVTREEPVGNTIAALQGRTVEVETETRLESSPEQVIESYRAFVKDSSDSPLRAEALRRLADLEWQSGENSSPEAAAENDDVGAAARLYLDLLASYPDYAGNDGVMYQLARVYEHKGATEDALSTFGRLADIYPDSAYHDEAQFRRGEILFVHQRYREAEQAYEAVLANRDSVYYERSLYKHGWSRFKQLRYEDALRSFVTLLDLKLGKGSLTQADAAKETMTRGDRELLDDTLRVISLSFAYLEGPDSIPDAFSHTGRRAYDYLLYRQLADLYLKQERIRDAAATLKAFTERYPQHREAPLFQVAIIDAYRAGNFPSQVLQEKEVLIERYGIRSDYWRAHDEATHQRIAPQLKSHLNDLARHYHAHAQKTRKAYDYRQAARWYQTYLESFPDDPQAASMSFLLAEALFESNNFVAAANEYERSAYSYPAHEKSAEAGYAVLLSYSEHEKSLQGAARERVHRLRIDSALRFADTFPADTRTPGVLTKAAEELFAIDDHRRAAIAAQRVVALEPPTTPALRRTAWTVLAHTRFDEGAFEGAERAYQEVLQLTSSKDPARGPLTERVAASIYKQGEALQRAGQGRKAAHQFLRVAGAAPQSPIAATAQYDAAAILIGLQDWKFAIQVLEGFRKTYPGHALNDEITEKLAVAYLQDGRHMMAAQEFGRIAERSKDPEVQREAAWKTAELYAQASATKDAAQAYRNYVQRFPTPLEAAVEARSRLASLYESQGDVRQHQHWLREIIKADREHRELRTDRTRYLAAGAALTLAGPAHKAFRDARLVLPLKKSLKTKKKAMEAALKTYEETAAYGVEEFTTAATYRIAEIYHQFGRDLLASDRPKGLSEDELEQYNVLLEEQAYPFEEKAIEIYQINAQRTADGAYDKWVRESLRQLSALRPVQYAKTERVETYADALQ